MFDANYDVCFIEFVNDVNVRSKSKSAKRSKKKNFWKPTGKVFTDIGYRIDQIAKIMGYGDYQMGKVAFCKHTCYIRDLEGVDILKGSRGSNLYTLSLEDIMLSSPICLLSKTSKTKSWLWHRSKKHSHKPKVEDTIQENLYLLHMDLCEPMRIQSINGQKYILVIVEDYFSLHSEDLGKLKPKADIGIFIGYAPARKAFKIYNKRTFLITKTIYVVFDELTYMASEQFSSGREPQLSTPGTLSSEFVPNAPSLILVASPVPTVVAPEHADSTGTPSSTHNDQDAPSLSTSQTHQDSQSPVIPSNVEEHFHDIEFTHLDNDPFFGVPILEPTYEESSSRDVIPANIIKKYGIETSNPVDTLMVEKSKLDADPQGKEVDPTRYHGMIGSLMYLTSSRPDLIFAVCMCARYHFIKEQVENGVVELYFVRIEYQLADIFTKVLGRERLDFLINKLAMRSMSPETLKRLAEEED
ncbi:hypothetical protein Tco_0024264 [Tanacetum coccineum]